MYGDACQTDAVLPQWQETMWLPTSSVNSCWPVQMKQQCHTLTAQMVVSVKDPGRMSVGAVCQQHSASLGCLIYAVWYEHL